MLKTMLRVGTASALVLAATVAVAQDTKSSETTKTTTTDPVTDAQTTTKSTTTTESTATPTTKRKSKSKTTTVTPATATTPESESSTTTSTSETMADAPSPAAAPAETAPATATPAPAAPATAPPAAATPAPAAPAAATPAAPTAPNPMVGGAAMDAAKTIVDNASAAPNLSTLVGAVKAADLTGTLAGPGPFTVFAPSNDAFGRVDAATLAALMKPENKAKLVKVLTYHVVPGTITAADLVAKADATGGTTTLTTVEGEPLTVKVTKANGGAAIEINDVNGNKSYLETPDVRQSNGIVHVVNGVLIPKVN